MIEIMKISKSFDDNKALSNVSATVSDGRVFGLIGTNGAGKSTMLRIMCGILRPDEGSVMVDGRKIYGDPSVSEDLFFISDDQFFFSNDTPVDLLRYYVGLYPSYNREECMNLLAYFGLPPRVKVRTFSKGMKKQLFVALGLASGARYLLCDETFDGLDPIMREKVKMLFRQKMERSSLTPVIASHSLRELQDICDSMIMLHRGGVMDLKENIEYMPAASGEMAMGQAGQNVQAGRRLIKINLILKKDASPDCMAQLNILSRTQNGSVYTLILGEDEESLGAKIAAIDPFFFETLPLTLEEMFIGGFSGLTEVGHE